MFQFDIINPHTISPKKKNNSFHDPWNCIIVIDKGTMTGAGTGSLQQTFATSMFYGSALLTLFISLRLAPMIVTPLICISLNVRVVWSGEVGKDGRFRLRGVFSPPTDATDSTGMLWLINMNMGLVFVCFFFSVIVRAGDPTLELGVCFLLLSSNFAMSPSNALK